LEKEATDLSKVVATYYKRFTLIFDRRNLGRPLERCQDVRDWWPNSILAIWTVLIFGT